MSANAFVRGPLSSPLSQWAFVGFSVIAIAGTDNLSLALQRALQMTTQIGGDVDNRSISAARQQPIVIHTGQSSSATTGSKYITSLMQITVGAGACWVGYVAVTNFLPDAIKELMPVTRKFFDAAVTTLSQGILNVRDVLNERMGLLSDKQDELGEKQDATHSEVLSVRSDVGDMRLDLESIHSSVLRCESSLSDAERKHIFTARGIRLLVRCVGALLPGNATMAAELDRFTRETSEEAQVPLTSELVDKQHYPPPTPARADDSNPQQQTPTQALYMPSKEAPTYQRMNSLPECAETERPPPSVYAGEGLDGVRGLLSAVSRSSSFSMRG